MIHTHPEGFLENREQHYQQFFGPLTQKVIHSTDIKPVHIDIYQFEPTEKRPFWTLVTSGMSDMRQSIPDDRRKSISPRAELIMYAPTPKNWMFSVLKGLAEMPFTDSTYLHWWHTVPNGMPMTAEPSLLTSFFFLPPYIEDPAFTTLAIDGEVDFLWMFPITEKERAFAVEHSSQELEEKLMEAQLSHVVDERRQSILG